MIGSTTRRAAAGLALVVVLPLLSAQPASAAISAVSASISTVAGSGATVAAVGAGDAGPALQAGLNAPVGVHASLDGSLLVTDRGAATVRRIANGIITTVAGTGVAGDSGDGGPAGVARLTAPAAAIEDVQGGLLIADTGNSRIRRIDPVTGTISTVAGTGVAGYAGDGGPALEAQLSAPTGLALGPDASIYIADAGNHTVRRLGPDGVITTVVGDGTAGREAPTGTEDERGRLAAPSDVAVDPTGNVLVADTGNDRVRLVAPGGKVTTLATLPDPVGLAVDSAGLLAVVQRSAHRVVLVGSAGVSVVAGSSDEQSGYAGDGGSGGQALLSGPTRATFNSGGELIVADTGNVRLRLLTPAGRPAAPRLTGSTPPSPSPSTSLVVRGSAPIDAIVTIHTDKECLGRPVGSGSATELADPGIAVEPVTADAVTELFATAGVSGHRSGCSTLPLRYVADAQQPAVPSVGTPDPQSRRRPVFPVRAEAGTTLYCQVHRGLVEVARGVCSDSYAANLDGEPDGDYELTVVATDAAGNVSAPGSASHRLDTTPPTKPGLSATQQAGGATARFRLEGGVDGPGLPDAVTTCSLFRDDVEIRSARPCAGPVHVEDLAEVPDGDLTLAAVSTDGAGNRSRTATATYSLDTTAPAAPRLSDGPAAGGDRQPSWTFDTEPGAMVTCTVTRGEDQPVAAGACSSPYELDLRERTDGHYAVAVQQTDGAGNPGPPAIARYELDTTAPTGPRVTGPSAGRDRAPRFVITAGEEGDRLSCELQRDGRRVGPAEPCEEVHELDLTGAADGTVRLLVTATDAVGLAGGQPGIADFTLDATAPPAPSVTAPVGAGGTQARFVVTATADPDVTLACTLRSAEGKVPAPIACTTEPAVDLSGLPAAIYTLHVVARDGFGNESLAGTADYELDTAAPAAPRVTLAGPPQDQDRRVSFRIDTDLVQRDDDDDDDDGDGDKGADGDTVRCEVTRNGEPTKPATACFSSYTLDLTGQPDATYTLSAVVVDRAGNVGTTGAASYTLDTGRPAVPLVSAPMATSGSSPRFAVVAEDGVGLRCTLTGPDDETTTREPCPRSYAPSLVDEPDGEYVLSVRATDAAGGISSLGRAGYLLDTAAPRVPRVTLGQAAGGPDLALAVIGESGAALRCSLRDGSGPRTETDCAASHTADLRGLDDGPVTVSVVAVDGAGNRSRPATAAYRLDGVAPGAPTVSVLGDPVGGAIPELEVLAEDGSTLTCVLLRGGLTVRAVAPCASALLADLTDLADGSYVVSVTATDAAGNISASGAAGYTLDTVPPEIPRLRAPMSPSAGPEPLLDISVAADTVSTKCTVTPPAGPVREETTCSSPYRLQLDGQEGTWVVTARAIDMARNSSVAVATEYLYDRTAPAVPSITVTASGAATRSYAVAAELGARTACTLTEPGKAAVRRVDCETPWSHDLSVRRDGTYVFSAIAIDAAGNVSPAAEESYRWSRRRGGNVGTPGTAPVPAPVTPPGAPPVTPPITPPGGQPPAGAPQAPPPSTTPPGTTPPGTTPPGTTPPGTTPPGTTPATPGPDAPTAPFPDSPTAPLAPPAVPVPGHIDPGDAVEDRGPDVADPGVPFDADPPPDSLGAADPGDALAPSDPAGTSPIGPGQRTTGGTAEASGSASQVARQRERVERALRAISRPGAFPTEAGRVAREAALSAVDAGTSTPFPLGLLAVVAAFLLVQDRFDRRDPKLAQAPDVAQHTLTFDPPR